MGVFAVKGSSFITPSIDIEQRSHLKDTDGDLLPDIVEATPRGEPVYKDGVRIPTAKGTGTDPYDRDTDNDGFSDGVEDNLGTSPTNWLNPGYIWIVWGLTILALALRKYFEPDRLQEYREFDQLESAGVDSKHGKFAYGSSTIFSKRASEMTDEEKKEAIQSDVRFQKLTGENIEEEKIKIRNKKIKMAIQLTIVAVFVIAIRYIMST